MQATLRRHAVAPDGTEIPLGTLLVMVESIHYRTVEFEGLRVRLPFSALRITCCALACNEEAAYSSPQNWCEFHWNQWFQTGEQPSGYAWKTASLKEPLSLPDGVRPAGTSVWCGEESLIVRVQVGDLEFLLDRKNLLISCEMEGCSQESVVWVPCYLCDEHHQAWLRCEFDLPSTVETHHDEESTC